jgi:hypothetical protein
VCGDCAHLRLRCNRFLTTCMAPRMVCAAQEKKARAELEEALVVHSGEV